MPSASDVGQLVEMGIDRALAEAALAKYGRPSDAAEAILEGRFELPDGASAPAGPSARPSSAATKQHTAQDKDDEDDDADMDASSAFGGGSDEDEDEEDFGAEADTWSVGSKEHDDDPYKDINMSKDRVQTTIDVEQIPRTFKVDGTRVKELTQSEWMKGCSEGNEQSLLFQLYQRLKEPIPCPSCQHLYKRTDGTTLLGFWPTLQEFLEHTRAVVHTPCKKCAALVCLACGDLVNADNNGTKKAEAQAKASDNAAADDDTLLHCAELQSLLLGAGLGHIERLYFDESKSGISAAAQAAMGVAGRKRPSSETAADSDGEDGASVKRIRVAAAGTGYAGSSGENRSWFSAAALKQQENDRALAEGLASLRTYLPTFSRSPAAVKSDYMPHSTTLAHLRRRLLPIASKLLSSDSFVDMTERRILYDELFLWLQLMSDNETLAPLVAQPIMLNRHDEVKTINSGKSREKHTRYEGSAGPRELLQSIVKQCTTVLDRMERQEKAKAKAGEANKTEAQKVEGASKMGAGKDQSGENGTKKEEKKDEKKDEKSKKKEESEADKLIAFCTAIIETTNKIDTLLRKTKGDAMVDKMLGLIAPSSDTALEAVVKADEDGEVEDQPAEKRRAYEAWAKTQIFADADLTVDQESSPAGLPVASSSSLRWRHVFHAEISNSRGDDSKRTMAIAKELASLQVSLPALWHGSIFLRVDESRIDVLKACIVGPEGSPYESGLFFFDIWLPSTYNTEPPKVKIITTNGGRYRFNPNLYADGKVCLSLLGTWSGPGWVSGRSTLLQVLLSIQSLIMGEEEPSANEPGWEKARGTKPSEMYTKNLRRMTVATAMLANLKEPPHPWKEVVEGHFRAKSKEILELVQRWLDDDDGLELKPDGASYMCRGIQMGIEKEDAPSDTPTAFSRDVTSLREQIEKLQT
ncbi:unnamed protein product [Tilletia controversa]|uniref:UBC core domain-containing protein n=1 Tax=Tilletia controversa TaxID=13291 RepID=A0A8X7MY58_9BASI|nr:hypothetical protein CF328_g607 [Tilletia controversa]KAE8254139.1 hypothetical protein A4X06_0g1049 [Tilletia controversa]CAD6959755.1 unnamed protein product [Tilletia controversa]CAD6980755.1 unnamed protein product [Tilletia controversa]CAD6986433.1 unnamed protein product [Tilletia controversa]